MKSKIHIVTLPRLTKAVRQVERELASHGFWNEELAQVEVELVPIGFGAYGYYDGTILVPSLSLPKIGDLLSRRYTALVDVVRHEFGHALEDILVEAFTSDKFDKAFGTPYEYDPVLFVSNYASKNTSEDFAETFMLYLKHGGKIPTRFLTKPIQKKWRFIKWLGRENARRNARRR